MHGLHLLADLMHMLEDIAEKQGGKRIVGVTITMGPGSHMSADHLREHFEMSTKGTLAEGAWLEVCAPEVPDEARDIVLESVELED